MTDAERDTADTPPIDESTYAGSSSETGGNYTEEGATRANNEGDTMTDDDVVDSDGPGSDPGEAYDRAVSEGQVTPDDEGTANGPGVGEVFRSGS